MSEKNLSGMSREDWAKFDALTDVEVETAIANDSDAQTPDDGNGAWRGDWVLKGKNEQIILPITVDIKTINYLTEHHIDCQSFLSGFLKAYVESQQKSNL